MIRYTILIIAVVLVVGCGSKREIAKERSEEDYMEFYSTFTEATKHALIGNFKGALALYKLCIDNYPEMAAPYYQVSNIYLTTKNLEVAKSYALKAVDREEDNKWYLMHVANIYQYEKNIDSVIYYYEKIVQISDNAEYKYNLAAFYSSKGDIKRSMKLVRELEKESHGMRELVLMKHQNFDAMNQRDSAVYQLETLVKLFPDEFENYGLLAEYLSEINRFEYARKIYNELLVIQPNNGLANISYGDFYLKQGKKDSALVYYNKGFRSSDIRIEDKIGILFNYIYDPVAIKADTNFIEDLLVALKEAHDESRPYTLSAEYYVKQKKYKLALQELRIAIEKEAVSYVVWEQYVAISIYLEQYDNVLEVYEEAIKRYPDKSKMMLFSAIALFAKERYEEVISVTEKAIKIKGLSKEDLIQSMNSMSDAYRRLKQYEVSDSIYEEVLKVEPEHLPTRNNYSYYLSLRNEKLDRAEELSRLTIRREPKNATYLDTYGWILYTMGNAKEGLKYIELAIKNGAHTNGEVLEHYGDIVYALKRCDEAIEAWNEAIKYTGSEMSKSKLELKIANAEEECKRDF